ncbi:hypothetical protein DV453_004171 [Geotrichum candidum]|nr:hypothetical protein DV453_004171 [Geotrichum candidum]
MLRLQTIAKHIFFTRTMSTAIDTTGFQFNHTMFRVKDPKRSVEFYEKNFGMKLYGQFKFAKFKFDNYYLGVEGAAPAGAGWWERNGILELAHNYGTENDETYTLNNGNVEPHRGFGHICFSVDNIEAACDQLEANGVAFKKKLTDGRQKDIAFALDPDGYWIELIENKRLALTKVAGVSKPETYKFNHTMIRVKDPKLSLEFYRNVLGMKLLRTSEHANAKFTLYFLGYVSDPNFVENSGEGVSDREAIVELTHNWGTENDADFKYHNGNDAPQGFGHFGITVPDVVKAMDQLEKAGVPIKKRVTDGNMKFIGFVLDPDNYWVEILPAATMPDLSAFN